MTIACIVMSDAAWAALGAVVSAVLGSIGYALSNLKAKRIDAESSLKNLAVQLGMREFDFATELARQRKGTVQPPEYFVYVAYMGLKDAECLSADNSKAIKDFCDKQIRGAENLETILLNNQNVASMRKENGGGK